MIEYFIFTLVGSVSMAIVLYIEWIFANKFNREINVFTVLGGGFFLGIIVVILVAEFLNSLQ